MRHGANVQIAYYDQQREQLDPERTVFDTVGEGNDTVTANGRTRHVHAYLRDFLFSDERARSPVKALSGGERNRLLLARLFTRPANVLVLDEPTNDLDLETLELLEEQLVEWPGTLLLVSHDRVFLDNVVTSTMVFEGDGRVAGVSSAATRTGCGRPSQRTQRGQRTQRHKGKSRLVDVSAISSVALASVASSPLLPLCPLSLCVLVQAPPAPVSSVQAPQERKRLSYKEQRELEALPARIEALESEQRALGRDDCGPSISTRKRPTSSRRRWRASTSCSAS